jgi:acyl-[acyl carrier protein]--UDP-N-acetylglucosamine O-acyltransferase
MPLLCGRVHVGEGTHIGAVVLPNLKIGKWCKIGAGAVVICDIPDFTTAVIRLEYLLKLSKYRRLISIFPDKGIIDKLSQLCS